MPKDPTIIGTNLFVNDDPLTGLPSGVRGDENGTKYLLRKKDADLSANCTTTVATGSARNILKIVSSGPEELYSAMGPTVAGKNAPVLEIVKFVGNNYTKTSVDVTAASGLNVLLGFSGSFWDANTSRFLVLISNFDNQDTLLYEINPAAPVLTLRTTMVRNPSGIGNQFPLQDTKHTPIIVRKSGTDYLVYRSFSSPGAQLFSTDLTTGLSKANAPDTSFNTRSSFSAAKNGDVMLLGILDEYPNTAAMYFPTHDHWICKKAVNRFRLWDPTSFTYSGAEFTVDYSSAGASDNVVSWNDATKAFADSIETFVGVNPLAGEFTLGRPAGQGIFDANHAYFFVTQSTKSGLGG